MTKWLCLTHGEEWSQPYKPRFCSKGSETTLYGEQCDIIQLKETAKDTQKFTPSNNPNMSIFKCMDCDYTWETTFPGRGVPDVCPLQSPEDLLSGRRHRIVRVK